MNTAARRPRTRLCSSNRGGFQMSAHAENSAMGPSVATTGTIHAGTVMYVCVDVGNYMSLSIRGT